jgi:CCR4-NOT complex subunit CAF16
VTVDLDVQVRDDLLSFLKEDSEHRSATILCAPTKFPHVMQATVTQFMLDATHIFDGLNKFPTHIAHMRLGSCVGDPIPWPLSSVDSAEAPDRTLFRTALQWLREDRELRRELEATATRKTRGARRGQVRTPLYFIQIIRGCARLIEWCGPRTIQIPKHFIEST